MDSFGYVDVLVKQILRNASPIEASMQTLMDELDDEGLRIAISKCDSTKISRYGLQNFVLGLGK